MEKAAQNPKILTVSDWSNFKSWEYMAAQDASDLSLLWVIFFILRDSDWAIAYTHQLRRQHFGERQRQGRLSRRELLGQPHHLVYEIRTLSEPCE